MNIFKSIGDFFVNLFKSPALKAFEAWLAEVWTAEKALIGSQLMNFAIQEVSALMNNSTLTGAQKQSQAFANIATAAKNAAIQAASADINMAVEMAYQSLTNAKNANAGITVNGQVAPVLKVA